MRNQSVYVMEAESGLIKIGVSCNPKVRTKNIATQSGFRITKEFHTKKCSNALALEKELHAFFKDFRVFGEWFKVDFDTAVNKVKSLFDEKNEGEAEENGNGLSLLFYTMHYSYEIVRTSPHLCPKVTENLVSVTVAAVKNWLVEGAPTNLVPLSVDTIALLLKEVSKKPPEMSIGYYGNIDELIKKRSKEATP